MLTLLVRGALAGAAMLGLLVAVLGGAGRGLVLTFWGVGTLGVLLKEWGAARWSRRRNERGIA